MALKILIVPDKFKGTLTAHEAAAAMADGWRRARPDDDITCLPASDGGDGFGEVMGDLLSGKIQHVRTVDAAHRPCAAKWWWEPKTRTAVIESARAAGLAQLPPGKFHPFALDTFGLGKIIQAAAAKGAKRCLLGIGGSATNEGGFGLAKALGWEFLTRDGETVQEWTGLERLGRIVAPRRRRWFDKLSVAVDVANPLLGRHGATRVYGPQKGLHPKDFALAERALGQLALVVRRQLGRNVAAEAGAGAAGGLGFGLRAFFGASLDPGFDLFARHTALDRQLRRADVVLTGEGAIDRSTMMGKGAGEIARRCRKLKIPCLAFAGSITMTPQQRHQFAAVHALTELTTRARAMAKPKYWLARLSHEAAQRFSAENL